MTFHKPNISLKKTVDSDLDSFFRFFQDEASGYMAAFMPPDHANHTAFIDKHTLLLQNPTVNYQTIWMDDLIVGSISKFVMEGEAELTYWLDKNFWGRGIVTQALSAFLLIEHTRPLYGRVAFDNLGSQKVLENNGFKKIGTDKGYARARQQEIEEWIYMLQ